MLIRDTSPRRRWFAVVLLGGLVLGLWAAEHWRWRPVEAKRTTAAPPVPAAVDAGGPLPLLEVAIADADWAILAAHRERAMAAGVLEQDDAAVVPVALRRGEETATGRARLKGDWLDHVDTDQWSLRFELDRPLHGMRRFSIQHPKTRGFVMEWLVMQAATRLGVIAPRVEFVAASIRGGPQAVWYLEEHPAKELLEARGRRDGPIVRFDETGMWGTMLQYGVGPAGGVPAAVARTTGLLAADVQAFGEPRLLAAEDWNRRLHRAIDQARALQELVAGGAGAPERLHGLQALLELDGRTIDDLFVPEKLGRWLALLTFFQGFHGLGWHQLRFHHDPLTDRLEPIVFDTGAGLLVPQSQLVMLHPDVAWFYRSPRVMLAAHEQLGRMTAPGWAEQLANDLRPELLRVTAAMQASGLRVEGFDTQKLIDVVFREQAESVVKRAHDLAAVLRPRFAASFAAELAEVDLADGGPTRVVDVRAWSRTEMPVVVRGFRLANGIEVPAAQAIVGLAGLPDSAAHVVRLPDGAVLLPTDGSVVLLRFLPDRRLAGLSEIAAIKSAIRRSSEGKPLPAVDVAVVYRTAAESEDRSEPLWLRARLPDGDPRQGRPPGPTLAQALARHAFLVYDGPTDRLLVPAGRHPVGEDLLLPEDRALHLLPGAELVLAPGVVLVAGAVQALGTAAQPIRIVAADPLRGCEGVLVLGAAGPSKLSFVEFRGATEIHRGAWITTGGVTFVGAPVEMNDCRIEDAKGEDALNLVHVRIRLERCTFARSKSDELDGDFVTGQVIDCRFEDSGADGLDVSGSSLDVRGCHFERIGDKALSIGEGSDIEAHDCVVVSASIAVASKDRSSARIDGLRVGTMENYVATCYVKKPEFGPSTMVVTGLRYEGPGAARHLAMTGCSLTIDGVVVPTQPVDVEALYRQGILGK